jgi:uncharacterized NAD-dependent epimerase/dehydratase family protein
MLTSQHRLAILLHEGIRGTSGKTGLALLRFSEAEIVAVIDKQSAGESLTQLTGIERNIPIVASLQDALIYQPNVLAIGIAPSGGALPVEWQGEVQLAIKAGISIANGLHTKVVSETALQPGQWIWNMRQEPPDLGIAGARARTLNCRRVLTVGTDMSVGKMSTSIELNRASHRRGLHSKFIATGQAGLMIAGDGIALDAVRVDFAAGAVEQIVLQYGQTFDTLYIEGQGSLLHPGSTATLPLIRGSQPTHLVLVHRAGQIHVKNNPDVVIPPLRAVIQLYEVVAGAAGALQPAHVVAIALNTHHLDETAARKAIIQTQQQTGLPCTDPVRFGAHIILDAIIQQ